MENKISIVTEQEAADRRSFHVQRINGAHQKTIESIFELSRYLNEAEEQLGRKGFSEMANSGELPFKLRTADKYKAISKNKILSNPENIKFLPPSFGSLYVLSTFNHEEFEEAKELKIINPGADRKDFESFKKEKCLSL